MMARFYCCSVEGCDYAFWTSARTFSPHGCPTHDALLIRGPESRPTPSAKLPEAELKEAEAAYRRCDESGLPPCTCTVTGPGYDETTTDPACPYHGENGSMVVTIRATAPYFGGQISRDDPRLPRGPIMESTG